MSGLRPRLASGLPRTRAGFSLLRALLALVVIAALGLLTWTTLVNWRATGTLTFHPFDAAWWAARPAPTDRALNDPGGTALDEARSLATQAKEKLWGPGGVVEQVETWWGRGAAVAAAAPGAGAHPAPGAPTANAPVAPAAAGADRATLERQLAYAQVSFRSGLDASKRGAPAASPTPEVQRAALAEARTHFQHAHDLLAQDIPAYAALADHDPRVLENARQLLDYDEQLLALTAPPR